LEQGQAKLEQGQAKLEQGQAKLEQGQAKLEQGQAKLEQGQAEIRQELGDVRQELGELTTLVHGVIHHQNEDFAVTQGIEKTVKHLKEVTSEHDIVIQKLKAL
ncbi:MAG: hypothetical protein FWE34_09605, partial [Defluviitaleaceae bacterium]|nr:hypothetical protein [Defluviitaleaceae bacterium]